MKSIKFLTMLFAAAALSAFADVEALYWQVTPESNVNDVEFTAAALGATDGSITTYFKDSTGNAWQGALAGGKSTEMATALLGDGTTDYTGWSFFIELQNYDDANNQWYTSGRSDNIAYNDIKSRIFSTANPIAPGMISVVSPDVHVPEPTSGLLMLLGGALLALRRRRA